VRLLQLQQKVAEAKELANQAKAREAEASAELSKFLESQNNLNQIESTHTQSQVESGNNHADAHNNVVGSSTLSTNDTNSSTLSPPNSGAHVNRVVLSPQARRQLAIYKFSG